MRRVKHYCTPRNKHGNKTTISTVKKKSWSEELAGGSCLV